MPPTILTIGLPNYQRVGSFRQFRDIRQSWWVRSAKFAFTSDGGFVLPKQLGRLSCAKAVLAYKHRFSSSG
jgi:hypothetical protein